MSPVRRVDKVNRRKAITADLDVSRASGREICFPGSNEETTISTGYLGRFFVKQFHYENGELYVESVPVRRIPGSFDALTYSARASFTGTPNLLFLSPVEI